MSDQIEVDPWGTPFRGPRGESSGAGGGLVRERQTPPARPRISPLCKLFGHKIKDAPWRYEQGKTLALVGGEELSVPVTWACCEVCSRCGLEVWTPW